MSCGPPARRLRSTSPATRAGTSWTGHRWPWSSPAAERAGPAARSAVRRFEAAQIPVLVGPGPYGGVPEALECGTEDLGLIAAQFEQHRPARAQAAGCVGDHTAQDVGTVRAAVVVGGILEPQGVSGKQMELGGGD